MEIKEFNRAEYVKTKFSKNQELKDIGAAAFEYVRTMGANSALTDSEFRQFMEICYLTKSNPLKREIYAIKYGNKFQIIVGYQTYIQRAERTGLLEYWNVDIEEKDGKPYKATFKAKRKDYSEEHKKTLWFDEWNQKQGLWLTKPFFMFEKCAIATGFRELFSIELSALPYTMEEQWDKDIINQVQKIDTKQLPKKVQARVEAVEAKVEALNNVLEMEQE